MSITVVFPEELLVATREEPEAIPVKSQSILWVTCTQKGKYHGCFGAQILGCNRLFTDYESEHGFWAIAYTKEK